MTRERIDKKDTPGSAWIRDHPDLEARSKGYDLENIDRISSVFIWHQFYLAKLMLFEEKCFYADTTKAQKDTFGVFSQACRFAFGNPNFRVKRFYPNRPTHYTFCGYNLVQYERTSPLDGGIRINYKQVTVEEYLRFLQFDPVILEKLRIHQWNISTEDCFTPPQRKVRKRNQPVVATLFNPLSQPGLFDEVLI